MRGKLVKIERNISISIKYARLQEEINSYITEIENNFKRITVNKSMQLIKKSFYYGIKLDNELLREYFRNHIT